MRNALPLAVCIVLLAFFAVRADHFARHTSQTFDEGAHLVAGVSYWRTGDFRVNPEHPPLLKLLWAIPVAFRSDVRFDPDPDAWDNADHWRLADSFVYDGAVDHFEMLIAARRVNIVLGVALVALIGWWAYRLWSRGAGVLACALAATDPNLTAFAGLLSMDLGLTLFATAASYAFWEYVGSGSRRWFVLAGVLLGLGLAAKFSAVIVVGGLVLGVGVLILRGGSFALPGPALAATRGSRFAAAVAAWVRLGLIAALVVIVPYAGIHALDWPRGFKQQMVRGQLGDPHFFLDGEISSTGWWRYFPEVLALKTANGTLFLVAVSVATLRAGARLMRREIAFLVVPAAVYFLAMAAAKIDLGWRVILPAYPALVLIAARASTLVPRSRVLGGILLGLSLLANLADVPFAGRELSHANIIVVGRQFLHRHLGDSNLDWGQGLKALKTELALRGDPVIFFSYAGTARPEAYGIRYQRLPGWGEFRDPPADRVDLTGRVLVAVSVGNLQGTYLRDPTMYRWLLDREPVSRTDDSIWVFDVTGDEEAIGRLRRLATAR